MDSKGGPNEHVRHLLKKTGMRSWMIIHLKRTGIEKEKLIRIYSAIIRPICEYASQAFHYQLTKEQAERIESIQRRVLKTIYGCGTSYREALERSGLQRLAERRMDLCMKFAKKTAENQRYSHWFPPNEPIPHNIRRRRQYKEERTSTKRLQDNPVYQMRRMLNSLAS